VSLPGRLRSHGYKTYALGKITHHPGGLTGGDWDAPPEELAGVWDRSWIPDTPWRTAEGIMHGYANGKPRERGVTPPFEAFDGPDNAYPDAWVADAAIEHLRALASSDEPWFFGVGFFKPHLPFAAPRSFHNRHDPSAIPVPPVDPRERERIGWHESSELRKAYNLNGRDPATDPASATELRRAYAAATSYSDAQLGRVLAEIRRLGLEENTIIVVWSDHGFLLGEHGIWGKHTLFDDAVRSPLIIRYPGMPAPGSVSAAIVETVDIYPTLLDLCGLPAQDALDGRSLRPQLEDPAAPGTKPARSFWADGRSLRTDRWQLIAGTKPGSKDKAVELYDLASDPDGLRDVAAQNADVVTSLLAKLNAR
jgi:iduronate 2-sulfatase